MSAQNDVVVDRLSDERTPLLPPPVSSPLVGHATAATLSVAAAKTPRLLYLDHIRGLLMVLQSIDHSRLFLSRIVINHENWWDMPDFQGSLYHWFVRILTAACAPGFAFALGLGVVLFARSRMRVGWGAARILRHFFIRGAVLIVANFAMLPRGMGVVTTVLFALGVNIFVGGCIFLLEDRCTAFLAARFGEASAGADADASASRRRATNISLACYALAAAAIAPLASIYTPSKMHVDTAQNWLFRLLFLPHPVVPGDTIPLFSMYAPVPWLPAVLLGLFAQRAVEEYAPDARTLARCYAGVGAAMLAVFIPLRWAEGFGNINPEELHPSPRHSFINFFNLSKYPPDLAYQLFTLGAVLLLCALFVVLETVARRRGSRWTSDRNPLTVFGRSAFFFYIAHFYVFRGFRFFLTLTGDIVDDPAEESWMSQSGNLPDGAYWISWVVGLVVLYWMCERYGRFKAGTSPTSIWRFF